VRTRATLFSRAAESAAAATTDKSIARARP
jgi:hypothetical protein